MSRLSQQRQDVLRILIGDTKYSRSRLHQDLGSSELGGFLGKVCIADTAFRFAQIRYGIAQRDHIALESRRLKRSQTSAKAGYPVDHLVAHASRTGNIPIQGLCLSAAQFIQSSGGTAQAAGLHRSDAQSGLLIGDYFTTQLEQGTATGNLKRKAADRRVWIQGQTESQRGGIH